MKKLILLALILTACEVKEEIKVVETAAPFTNLVIRNSSDQDSIKVYVTLQAPNPVMGLFGITDTISGSKGFFYAQKGIKYSSNTTATLLGVVISFGGDNLPCQIAVGQGFPTGINIFECSVNTPFEVFDISCEDGVNAVIRTTVSDTLNWSTGDGTNQLNFRSTKNKCLLQDNLNIRGVFPYRCTDCIDLGKAIPQNCFNLKDTCNTIRACQVARTNNIGGTVLIEYVSPVCQIAN